MDLRSYISEAISSGSNSNNITVVDLDMYIDELSNTLIRAGLKMVDRDNETNPELMERSMHEKKAFICMGVSGIYVTLPSKGEFWYFGFGKFGKGTIDVIEVYSWDVAKRGLEYKDNVYRPSSGNNSRRMKKLIKEFNNSIN